MRKFFEMMVVLGICVLLVIIVTKMMTAIDKPLKPSDLSPPSSKDVMIEQNLKEQLKWR